jgi:hypothetical protein
LSCDDHQRPRSSDEPGPLIGWAAVIVVLLVVSAMPYFLGLLVTLPVLGHATAFVSAHLRRCRSLDPPACTATVIAGLDPIHRASQDFPELMAAGARVC